MSGPLLTAGCVRVCVCCGTTTRRCDCVDPPGAGCPSHELRTRAVETSGPSLLILGADAVAAALPATPVQVAHACLASGFDHVIPASWGDELVAEHVVARVQGAASPMVQCSCPCVVRRLAPHAEQLDPVLMRIVSPPVALARYLRTLYASTPPHVTFVGACPAGDDPSIDAWLAPEELFRQMDRRGITPAAQPTVFDSVLRPDRRRYWSVAGGVPMSARVKDIGIEIREIAEDDFVPELAEELLSDGRLLLDVALSTGCSCSGVIPGVPSRDARARIADHEPPRSLTPVIDATSHVQLDETRNATPPSTMPVQVRSDVREPSDASEAVATVVVAPAAAPRRSPVGITRPVLGAMPLTRRETGRQLPRAYIARRRSSPRGLRLDSGERVRGAGSAPESGRTRRLTVWVGLAGLAAGLGLAWLARALF
jgi:Iron only hydrogenase large subunit, C-terminal domain